MGRAEAVGRGRSGRALRSRRAARISSSDSSESSAGGLDGADLEGCGEQSLSVSESENIAENWRAAGRVGFVGAAEGEGWDGGDAGVGRVGVGDGVGASSSLTRSKTSVDIFGVG